MGPAKLTLVQCISKVIGIIAKYPFSIFLLVLILFTLFTIIFNKKMKTRAPKVISVLSWLIVAGFMIVKYAKSVTFLRQTLKSGTFSSIYFPNVITYIVMLLISLVIFLMAIIRKEKSVTIKIINAVSFGIIWVNFILILRELFKNNITIYDPLTIYKYEGLQVLIQTSTWIFVFWMMALGINYVAKLLTKNLDSLAEKQNKKITK